MKMKRPRFIPFSSMQHVDIHLPLSDSGNHVQLSFQMPNKDLKLFEEWQSFEYDDLDLQVT